MNDDRVFERAVDEWLADGSDRTPGHAIDAVLLAVMTTPQERDLRIPWRTPPMSLQLRLAAAIAIFAVVGYAGLTVLNSRPLGPGSLLSASPSSSPPPSQTATPLQTPTPTVNLDTATWTQFTSDRYDYTIKHPADWEAEPATRDWTMDQDRTDWLSPAQDHFIDNQATYQIGVLAFAVDVPSDMSADQWIDEYIPGTGDVRCLIKATDMPAITVDGHAGKLADQQACSDTIAFVSIDGRMYVFKIARDRQVPLFEAFLSTVTLPASGSASPAPS